MYKNWFSKELVRLKKKQLSPKNVLTLASYYCPNFAKAYDKILLESVTWFISHVFNPLEKMVYIVHM